MVDVLLFIAGLCLAILSFPAREIWLGGFAWIAFVPLIYLTEKHEIRDRFLINWLFFYLAFLFLFWLNPTSQASRFENSIVIVPLFILFFLFPVVCTLVILLAKHTASKFPIFSRPFIYAGIWLSFEYIMTVIPYGFPLSMAITQANLPFLLQTVPALGIYGISFLLMTVNAALALAWLYRQRQLLMIAVAIFTINLFWGIFSLQLAEPIKHPITIGIIQPNKSWEKILLSNNKFFQSLELDKMGQLSRRLSQKGHPKLILWPELAAENYILQRNDQWLRNLAKEINTPLLIGTYFFDHQTNKPSNIAALISETGSTIGIYRKNILFPFIETELCQTGEEVWPLDFDRGIDQLGVMLCFESLHPRLAGQLVDRGASLLLLMANGAWFGNNRWPWLHMSFIGFRALENGRYAIHLNNTGPSVVVSPQGIYGQILPQGKTAIAMAEVEGRKGQTLYRMSHGAFPMIIMFISTGLIFWSIFFSKGVQGGVEKKS